MVEPTHENNIERFKRLSEFVVERMEEIGVPGVAVGILDGDQLISSGFGVTNVEHPLAVTEETFFQIGSITKTFTALLLLRLAEAGQLTLDAPLRTLLPAFRVGDADATERATVRHLLTHTGGWVGDFFRDTGAGDDALPRYLAEMANVEQLAPLGYTYSYNNAGFYVAGALIEAVTGQSYQAALREWVLEPLGLQNVHFDAADVMTHSFAVGHTIRAENGARTVEVARPWPLPRAAYAAGGIACPVTELLKYAHFQLGDGCTADGMRLLTSASMRQLQEDQFLIGGSHEAVALSWFSGHAGDIRYINHGGGTTGQISLLLIAPQRRFAVAIFTNANRGGLLTRDISRRALCEYLAVEVTDPTPLDTPESELTPYAGRYSRPYADVNLRVEEGELVAQYTPKQGFPSQHEPPAPPPPPARVAFYETDRLLVLDGPMQHSRAEFVRTADGDIGWLRFSGRIHRRADEIP